MPITPARGESGREWRGSRPGSAWRRRHVNVPEFETPVVRLACRQCTLEVDVAVDPRSDMVQTMLRFFNGHLTGRTTIEIFAV